MASSGLVVRHVRQILLWPLSLTPLGPGRSHADALLAEGSGTWSELADEFTGDAGEFQERHYREFVTFIPYVQRFLYGQGRSAHGARARGYGESPIRVLRRHGIRGLRLTFPDGQVLTCRVQHVDLYFFFDVDVALLAVEFHADDVPLARVQDVLYRFGRCYPAQWDEHGVPDQCLREVAWLDGEGAELVRSDFHEREPYLRHVCEHRVPRVGRHWDWLLAPMVQQYSDAHAEVRYRQLEYHRLPKLTYLAVDDPYALDRDDFVRLGLATAPDDGLGLPYSDQAVAEFERLHCYDRFWVPERQRAGASTRVLCTSRSVVMVGSAREPSYRDVDHGLLGQFRHQYFLLAMIAHFHRAALLMLRDRMVLAVSQLDLQDAESVARFRRRVRGTTETFLRFNHRYFFHEVSKQSMAEDLFRRLTEQLGTDALFDEVRADVLDMNSYLDSDATRRQGEIVLRLTVVTILGLVGTLVTGFLGMNLVDAADASLFVKAAYLAAVTLPAVFLTLITVQKSGALADVMDTLANERLDVRSKLRRTFRLLRGSPRPRAQL